MITVTLVLQVGRIKNGIFESYDEYDLEEDEDVSSLLYVVSDPVCDRARLVIHATGWPDNGRTLCVYKQLKVKTKTGHKTHWVVVNENN